MDFISNRGKSLRDNGYKDQNGIPVNPSAGHGTAGAGWEMFTCHFGDGILMGDTIIGIVLSYDHSGPGSWSAFFDDFLIEKAQTTNAGKTTLKSGDD